MRKAATKRSSASTPRLGNVNAESRQLNVPISRAAWLRKCFQKHLGQCERLANGASLVVPYTPIPYCSFYQIGPPVSWLYWVISMTNFSKVSSSNFDIFSFYHLSTFVRESTYNIFCQSLLIIAPSRFILSRTCLLSKCLSEKKRLWER